MTADLSFTDVTPSAAIVLGTLGSFHSDVSGDFSATVPEPSTWAMMLLGFAGLALRGARQGTAVSPCPLGDRYSQGRLGKTASGRSFFRESGVALEQQHGSRRVSAVHLQWSAEQGGDDG
jgi:PEP-CTERM motif